MNRRGFLAALAGAFVADPERALWVPGRKLISIPKPYVLNVKPEDSPLFMFLKSMRERRDQETMDWIRGNSPFRSYTQIFPPMPRTGLRQRTTP